MIMPYTYLRTDKFRCIPLFSRLIPLIGRQNSAVNGVAEFALNSNGINHLQGRTRPATGRIQRILLFFPRETGESGRC